MQEPLLFPAWKIAECGGFRTRGPSPPGGGLSRVWCSPGPCSILGDLCALVGERERSPSMKKGHFSRREFLQTSSGVAGGSLAASVIPLHQPLFAAEQAAAPSDRLRFGMVGIGMEGTNLLSTAIELPGVECAAACDLYDGRHELAREIVKK